MNGVLRRSALIDCFQSYLTEVPCVNGGKNESQPQHDHEDETSGEAHVFLTGHVRAWVVCVGHRMVQGSGHEDYYVHGHPRGGVSLSITLLGLPCSPDFFIPSSRSGEAGAQPINKTRGRRCLQHGHLSGGTLVAPVTGSKRQPETEWRLIPRQACLLSAPLINIPRTRVQQRNHFQEAPACHLPTHLHQHFLVHRFPRARWCWPGHLPGPLHLVPGCC